MPGHWLLEYTYDGYTFTWEQGRKLASIKGNGYNDISFKYNVDGIRTEKTVDGVTTKYHLVGDKVTYEDNGTDKIYYSYDSTGKLISMNLNGEDEYYYIRNGQGDIIGLYDKNGAEVVKYSYDSWGKLISIDGILKDTVGVKNPYRYRGYRYDTETGLYYLQSRYYNSEWGRFINADGIIGQTGELLGHNLFIYCKNNSINGKDPTGFKMVFADEETQRQYDQWIRTSSFTTNLLNDARLNDIDNGINSPKGAAIISKTDGMVGGSIAAGITASKKVNLDGTLGLTAHIKNPGLITKTVGGVIRATGVIAVAALGIGIANNFMNYEYAWERTFTDLALFGIGIKAGLMLAALNPVTLSGTAEVAGGGILIAYGVSWLDNKIKNDYLSERKK